MDEFTSDVGTNRSWIPEDNAELSRREKIWPTYFSGGNIEFILEGFLSVDNFKTPEREKLWMYLWHARKLMEEQLPFWEMVPMDDLVTGEATLPVGMGGGVTTPMGAQVFARPGSVYAVYFPDASETGLLNLRETGGIFTLRWYDPRTGEFAGASREVEGGDLLDIGPPPAHPDEDWVLLVERPRDLRRTD